MATLQDYLMLHRNRPEEAVRGAGEIGKLQIAKVSVPKAKSRLKPALEFSQRDDSVTSFAKMSK